MYEYNDEPASEVQKYFEIESADVRLADEHKYGPDVESKGSQHTVTKANKSFNDEEYFAKIVLRRKK